MKKIFDLFTSYLKENLNYQRKHVEISVQLKELTLVKIIIRLKEIK